MSKKLCKSDKKEKIEDAGFQCSSCGRLSEKKKKVCDPEPIPQKKK